MRTQFNIGRLHVSMLHRSRKQWMGRFGGGWNWNLGFQAGGRTVIFNLLVFSIRVWWER